MLKEISIEITRKCPNNCIYCSSDSGKNCSEKIPLDVFRGIIHDAQELGTEIICLSGGEPFLREDLPALTECVWLHGMKCRIYTSGITLDKNSHPQSLSLEVLKEILPFTEKLIFNIEAASESVYDRIMGTKNCFAKMKRSALAAAELRFLTEAHFVPMPLNIDEIYSVLELCRELNISRLSFLRLVIHGRALQNREILTLDGEEIIRLRKYLNQLSLSGTVNVRVGIPLSLDTDCEKCEAADKKLNIRYDGKVFPCEVFKNCLASKSLQEFSPESVYEHSLCDIYRHSDYLERVRYLSRIFADSNHNETCLGQFLLTEEKKERELVNV